MAEDTGDRKDQQHSTVTSSGITPTGGVPVGGAVDRVIPERSGDSRNVGSADVASHGHDSAAPAVNAPSDAAREGS
jgi:hypothetical protein